MPERVLQVLNGAMKKASEGEEIHEILQTLLADMLTMVGAERGAIGRVTPYGIEYNICQGFTRFLLPIDQGLTARVLKTRTIEYFPDVSVYPDYVSHLPDAADRGAELIIPLIFKKDVIGMINLYSETPDGFPSETDLPRWLYRSLAYVTATLMHLYRSKDDLKALHDITIHLGYILPILNLVVQINQRLSDLIQYNSLLIVDFEETFADVYYYNQYGFNMWSDSLQEGYRRVQVGDIDFIDWLRTLDKPVRVDSTSPDKDALLPRLQKIISDAQTFICSGPMRSDHTDDKIGIICCVRTGEIPFTHTDLDLLNLFSQSTAPSWFVSEEFERREIDSESTGESLPDDYKQLLGWLVRMQDTTQHEVYIWHVPTQDMVAKSSSVYSQGFKEQIRQTITRLTESHRSDGYLDRSYPLYHSTGYSLLVPIMANNNRLELMIQLYVAADDFHISPDYIQATRELGRRFVERLHFNHRASRLEELVKLNQDITSAVSPEDVGEKFIDAARQLFTADYIACYQDKASDFVYHAPVPAASHDRANELARDLERHSNVLRNYFSTHPEYAHIPDKDTAPARWGHLLDMLPSLLVFPVWLDGDRRLPSGAILIASRDENAFDDDDVYLLDMLVNQVKIVLEKLESTRRERKTRSDLGRVVILMKRFHDFKNSFNNMKMNSLNNQADLENIKDQYNRLGKKLEKLSDLEDLFSKAEESQFVQATPVQLYDMIQRCIETVQENHARKLADVQLVWDLPNRTDIETLFPSSIIEIPHFKNDNKDAAVQVIFDNLFVNALEAMHQDTAAPATLTISFQKDVDEENSQHTYLTVAITDTGKGISPEKQKMIFNFAYSDKDTLEKQINMGFGLWIIEYMMENSHGAISLDPHYTRPGQGARFLLHFSMRDT